nr:hypothetical protein Iba_chr12bCG26030 [Ipomoea batatas]
MEEKKPGGECKVDLKGRLFGHPNRSFSTGCQLDSSSLHVRFYHSFNGGSTSYEIAHFETQRCVDSLQDTSKDSWSLILRSLSKITSLVERTVESGAGHVLNLEKVKEVYIEMKGHALGEEVVLIGPLWDKDVKLTTYSFLSLTVGGSTKSLFFKEKLSSCPPISESMNSISSSVAGSDDSPAFPNLVLLCFAGGGGQSSIAGILFFSDSGVRSSNSSLLSSLVVSSPSISIPLASLSTSISSTVSFGRSWSITTFSSDMVWTLESTEMGKGLRGEIELLD